ncbi:MAG: NADH-quinone oxidoreductase subunit J [Candidatus Hinthialibacter antarcticus]|nr:NADH-quinone oxidoreductase subunit J [Candidatus Hinthialibacter antarcticus]
MIRKVDALLPSLLFYVFAGAVVGSAVFTAFTSNLVHAAFSLLFTFFGLACLYLYLGADFVGLAQVVIYVGGILVLLLFGVMFTGHQSAGTVKQTLNFKTAIVLMIVLFVMILPVVFKTAWPVAQVTDLQPAESTISEIANLLLGRYMLPFEVASLLLLVALIGAVVIARGEQKEDDADTPAA